MQRFVAAVAAAQFPSQSVVDLFLLTGSASDAVLSQYNHDLPFVKQDFSRFEEIDYNLFNTSPLLLAYFFRTN